MKTIPYIIIIALFCILSSCSKESMTDYRYTYCYKYDSTQTHWACTNIILHKKIVDLDSVTIHNTLDSNHSKIKPILISKITFVNSEHRFTAPNLKI